MAEILSFQIPVDQPALRQPGDYLFSRAHALYLVEADHLTEKTKRGYRSSHRTILTGIGDFPMCDLRPVHLLGFIRDRLRAVSPARVKRDLAYLSSLFRFACGLPDAPAENPVRAIDLRQFGLREGAPRTTWLTEGQFERLLAELPNPTHRAIVTLAVETGLRRDELLCLSWEEVDLGRGTIVLAGDRTKNKDCRMVPLTERARTALAGNGSPWVFPSPRTGRPLRRLDDWFKPAVHRIGLPDLRFHDLRHTFASWASQRGVEERLLQVWLGHRSTVMTRRYSHLRREDLVRAAAIFGEGA